MKPSPDSNEGLIQLNMKAYQAAEGKACAAEG